MRLGLVGYPVGHSDSPALHRSWLAELGLDGTYDAIPVDPTGDLRRQTLAAVARLDGANLTTPVKQVLLEDLALDDLALRTRAVNTVYRDRGRLCGTNTDVLGYEA